MDIINKVEVGYSLEPEIKLLVQKKNDDIDFFKKSTTNIKYKRLTRSVCSKFMILHFDWGFDIFDIVKGKIVDPFYIVEYDQFSLLIKINSKFVRFILNCNLKVSNLLSETIAFQKRLFCTV